MREGYQGPGSVRRITSPHSLSLSPRTHLPPQIQETQEPWGPWGWEIIDCLVVIRSALTCNLASLPPSAEGATEGDGLGSLAKEATTRVWVSSKASRKNNTRGVKILSLLLPGSR